MAARRLRTRSAAPESTHITRTCSLALDASSRSSSGVSNSAEHGEVIVPKTGSEVNYLRKHRVAATVMLCVSLCARVVVQGSHSGRVGAPAACTTSCTTAPLRRPVLSWARVSPCCQLSLRMHEATAAVAIRRPNARACTPIVLSLSSHLTLSLCMPLPPSQRLRHSHGVMTFSASSTPRRLARSCCRVQVTRTALASVSSVPKHSQRASRHSLVQLHRALQPLRRPLSWHLGLPLLSLRRALPPPLWAWTWASIRHC
jgi:hypothetical protein